MMTYAAMAERDEKEWQTQLLETFLPFVEAIKGASGIDEFQAWTCAIYAVVTYHDFDPRPVLAVIGPTGSGKSTLLRQLAKMMSAPVLTGKMSIPVLRDKMNGTPAILIDEGDGLDEDFLVFRSSSQTSGISFKKGSSGSGYQDAVSNIFGYTVIGRRLPFRDAALRNRSIVIKTKRNPGKYAIADVAQESFAAMAKAIQPENPPVGSGRVSDTWGQLLAIAKAIGLSDWLAKAQETMVKEERVFQGGQNHEADAVVIMALTRFMLGERGEELGSVKVSDIAEHIRREFALDLKPAQVREVVTDLGFEVRPSGGYDKVKSNIELLGGLKEERGLV